MFNVRDCASSAKSVVIVFDDRSDVSGKTMKVTIPSLPKENDVPVEINVTELRPPQGNFFFGKNNRVGFHRCAFRRDRAPRSCTLPVKKLNHLSQKAQEIIRVFRWRGIRTNLPCFI